MKFSQLRPRLFLLVMLAALSCMARADLLVTDNTNHRVLRYSNAGVALGTFITSGTVAQIVSTPVFGPDGNLYFLDLQNEVLRFNSSTGAFIDTFVPASSGLLPTALTFGPDGNLYVADRSQVVKRFNGKTGVFLGVFTTGFTLVVPADLAFGPDGNLYVADEVNVVKFDGTTGAFISIFVANGSGGLLGPGILAFRPDGNLWVDSAHSGILRYNAQTGAFVSQFVPDFGIRSDGGLAFGPDGNVYVAYFNGGNPIDFVNAYNGQTGQLIGTFVPAAAAGVIGGIAFTPDNTQAIAVVPNHGGNSGSVTVQVIGGNFQPGALLKLTGIGPDIVGSPATASNPSAVAGMFDLRGATTGVRNIVVLNPDNSISTLPAAFTVEQGGASQVWVEIVGKNLIRFGREQGFFIAYGNRGNLDALGIHLVLTFPSSLDSSLGFANEVGVVTKSKVGPNVVVVINLGRVPASSNISLPLFLTTTSSQTPFILQATLIK
jgi:sugar lactone lactonase YvrE